MGIGLGQIIILFLIVLLFFGARRLPEIAKALGKASNEFHKAKRNTLSPSDDDKGNDPLLDDGKKSQKKQAKKKSKKHAKQR